MKNNRHTNTHRQVIAMNTHDCFNKNAHRATERSANNSFIALPLFFSPFRRASSIHHTIPPNVEQGVGAPACSVWVYFGGNTHIPSTILRQTVGLVASARAIDVAGSGKLDKHGTYKVKTCRVRAAYSQEHATRCGHLFLVRGGAYVRRMCSCVSLCGRHFCSYGEFVVAV